mmetsp:Transcript_11653/g.33690  ORF Transcript_11653/g.33690 Transcript_11653/m.33690 type:complete len:253 (+) Transcript_11653:1233-1991(+)
MGEGGGKGGKGGDERGGHGVTLHPGCRSTPTRRLRVFWACRVRPRPRRRPCRRPRRRPCRPGPDNLHLGLGLRGEARGCERGGVGGVPGLQGHSAAQHPHPLAADARAPHCSNVPACRRLCVGSPARLLARLLERGASGPLQLRRRLGARVRGARVRAAGGGRGSLQHRPRSLDLSPPLIVVGGVALASARKEPLPEATEVGAALGGSWSARRLCQAGLVHSLERVGVQRGGRAESPGPPEVRDGRGQVLLL